VSDNGSNGDTAVDNAVTDVANVENFYVRNLDAGVSSSTPDAATLDASGWTEAEQIWLDRDNSVTVTDVQGNATLGLNNADDGETLTADYAADAIGSAEATLNVAADASGSAGSGNAVGVNATTAGSDVFTSASFTVIDDSVVNLTLADASSSDDTLTSLNVAGAGALTLTAAANEFDNLTEITAGDGGLTIDTGGANTENLAATTGAGDDNLTLDGGGNKTVDAGDGDNVVTVGAGNDDVTTGAGDDTVTISGGDDTVAAGGGDDRVNVGGNLTEADSIDGGAGDADVVADTSLNLAGYSTAALGALSNFERVAVTNSLGDNIDASDFGAASSDIVLESGASTATLSGLVSGATVSAAGGVTEVTLQIAGATDAASTDDELTLVGNADLTGSNVTQGYQVEGVNNLTFVAEDSDNTTGNGTDGYVVKLANNNNVNTLTVTGDQDVTIEADNGESDTNDGFASLTSVDTSGNADTSTVDLSNFAGSQGVSFTGGDANEVFTGTSFGDVMSVGGGDNIAYGGQGADQIDLGSGEAGNAGTANLAFDGLIVGAAADFNNNDNDIDYVGYQNNNDLTNANTASNGTFGTSAADKISNFNVGQDTILITGGVADTGEAAILDTGSAESTNDFTNGAIKNNGSGVAEAASGDQGIYQIALGLGDEDESGLTSAADLLDEAKVLEELEIASGETGGGLDGVVALDSTADAKIDDLDQMVFTIYGPEGSGAIYRFSEDTTDGDAINAGELSLVGLMSDGDVNAEFDLA
jgi:hypothetical protein